MLILFLLLNKILGMFNVFVVLLLGSIFKGVNNVLFEKCFVVLLFFSVVKLFGILLLLLFLLLIYCIVCKFKIKFFFVSLSSELFVLFV